MSLSKEHTENAYETIEALYQKTADKKTAKEFVKKALEKQKFFEGRGYIFIIRASDGVWEMLPSSKSKEGSSALGNRDDEGDEIFGKIKKSALANPQGSFVSYKWYPPGENKMSRKTSYVKYFKELDWIIGAGEYDRAAEEAAKTKAVAIISKTRFGADGYTSLYDSSGKIISVPSVQKLAGVDVYATKDPVGQKAKDIVETLTKQAKTGGGYYRYEWLKPSSGALSPKIAYAEEFEEWGWIIASGIYMDDIQNEIAKQKAHIEETHAMQTATMGYIFVAAIAVAGALLYAFNSAFSATLLGYKNSLETKNRELKELNESLETKIAAEIAKNDEKHKLIIKQSRSSAMGEMISAIAHHWRQPLNAVSIIIQDFPFAKEYGELDDEYLQKNVEKATSIINDMSKSIDVFRSFFTHSSHKDRFVVDKKILDIVELFAASLEDIGVTLELDLNSKALIYGYPSEFAQTIISAVSNSKEAIGRNKIKNGKIKIRSFMSDGYVAIEVEDNGGGISQETLQKAFEPYFTTKQKTNGVGMGLYSAKAAVEDGMDGKITLESLESGAKLSICLPVATLC